MISLYTSRVILGTLGVEDFGIYNVVGGVVAMFTIISGSLTAAISRFITFELGKGNIERLKIIFSTSVNILLVLSIIIVIIGEIAGLWFLNSYMNIPKGRLYAANYILQCSLGIFVLNLLCIPYNSVIIAHEKMKAYAYFSILDFVLKLGVAYAIILSPFDRLASYGALLLGESLVIRMIYGIYSKRNFEECAYSFVKDKSILKKMVSFAGWNFLGVTAGTMNTQGVNILMNLFFGVTVNAARGIAMQASSAISQFVQSFTVAVNPQITKSYAVRDDGYLYSLVLRSAKFSSFLFLLVANPLIVETPYIFKLWLNEVPESSVIFFRLGLLGILMDSVLGNSLMTVIFATGDIRKYQIYVTFFGGMVFPITWITYWLGAPAESTYIIYFAVYCIVLYVRLYVVQQKVGLKIKDFFFSVIIRLLPIAIISCGLSVLSVSIMQESLLRLVISTIVSLSITTIVIYAIGLTNSERRFVIEKIKSSFIRNLRNKI